MMPAMATSGALARSVLADQVKERLLELDLPQLTYG